MSKLDSNLATGAESTVGAGCKCDEEKCTCGCRVLIDYK
jgi:hypothetical protein